MIKAIFFDIDGTLICHADGQVPKGTQEALIQLREKGIKICLATGRHINEIAKLPVSRFDFDGYITLNGQICLDGDWQLFHDAPIHPEDSAQIAAIFAEKEVPAIIVERDRMYIDYVDQTVEQVQKAISTALPQIGVYRGDKIYQFIVFAGDEKTRQLLKRLPHCKLTKWNAQAVDIIPADGGKLVGIEKYLKLHGLRREEVMAFGDGNNDVEMLRYCQIGVAMGNASPQVKASADFVTSAVDRDGIQLALKHYGVL